jgi:hypothetical protein
MIARYAIVIVALLASGSAFAESLDAEAALRFVVDKLFAFTCFDGSRGTGRFYGDGSVIGTVQLRGAAYANWLATSSVPKLFVKAEPGLLVGGGANLDFASGLPSQAEVMVRGLHFVQEDSPHEIGQAIASWMGTLG